MHGQQNIKCSRPVYMNFCVNVAPNSLNAYLNEKHFDKNVAESNKIYFRYSELHFTPRLTNFGIIKQFVFSFISLIRVATVVCSLNISCTKF
jgi:hypothetical protein